MEQLLDLDRYPLHALACAAHIQKIMMVLAVFWPIHRSMRADST